MNVHIIKYRCCTDFMQVKSKFRMSLFINNGRKSSALLTAILILIILTLFNACKRDVMNIYWKNLNIMERNIRFDNPAGTYN